MPHILITNDDGIYAEGLRALVAAFEGIGTVSVVAPIHERSAAAQSLTLRQPIFCEQVAEREWAIEGTPTDAMIVALHRLFSDPPDLVVSVSIAAATSAKTFSIPVPWAPPWKPPSIMCRPLRCPWCIAAPASSTILRRNSPGGSANWFCRTPCPLEFSSTSMCRWNGKAACASPASRKK